MKNEIKINNYISKGIIEANINYSKEHNSYFSLVKFGCEIDLDDALKFKELISFVHIFSDFSPILLQDGNSFLIFLKDMKIHHAKALVNKMDNLINKKFSIELKNIGITVNHNEDTYKKLLDRVDKYYVMSKLSSKKRVFYGTVDFDYYDAMDTNKILRKIFEKSPKVTLHNLFKGIPIKENTNISSFKEGQIRLKVKKSKIPFYQKEEFTFIEHDLIPDIIKASIKEVDSKQSYLLLDDLKLLQSSPVERSDIRVEPSGKVRALINKDGQKIAEGFITTIAENSLSLDVDKKQIETLIEQSPFDKEIEVSFQIINRTKPASSIKTKAYIFSIVNNKVVLNIFPTVAMKEKIREYISSRQNEILNILKRELKRDVK